MASRIGNLLASSDPVPTQSDPEFANYNNVERRLIVKSGGDKTKLLKLYRRVKGRGGYFAGAKHAFAVVPGAACTVGTEAIQAAITSDLLRTNGNFGSATLLRGNVLLVGERRAVGTIFEVGEAHLFTRPNESSDFTYQSSFLPITEASGGVFGDSLAANSDCTIIAGGAPNQNGGAGRVFTYTRSGTTVSDDEELVPNTAQTSAYFGADMGMSSDGNHLIVSLPGYDGTNTDEGLVEYWENVAGTWTYRSDLSSGTAFVAGQRFGHACAMNPDGTECWVMKRLGTNSSRIERFTRSGTTWTYQDNFELGYGTGQMGALRGSMDASSDRIIFGFGARDSVFNNEGFVLVTDHSGVETSSIEGDTLETEFGYSASIDEGGESAIGEWLADPSATTNAGTVDIWQLC